MISTNICFIKQEKPNTNSQYNYKKCIQVETWMQENIISDLSAYIYGLFFILRFPF